MNDMKFIFTYFLREYANFVYCSISEMMIGRKKMSKANDKFFKPLFLPGTEFQIDMAFFI